jgi:tagatose 1,6-diphosphate aldolase
MEGVLPDLPPAPSCLRHGEVELRFLWLTEADEEKGFVPGYRFDMYGEHGLRVGTINFRVGETSHVRLYAGHVGYTVFPEFRGCGYALQACRALGPFIAEVMGEVIITSNPDNLASIRTIEKLGAEYLGEVDVNPEDPHFDGGRNVRKRRYRWVPVA